MRVYVYVCLPMCAHVACETVLGVYIMSAFVRLHHLAVIISARFGFSSHASGIAAAAAFIKLL